MHVYDDANHSLEKGDVMANLYVFKVTRKAQIKKNSERRKKTW